METVVRHTPITAPTVPPRGRAFVLGGGDIASPERIWARRYAGHRGMEIVVLDEHALGAASSALPEDVVVVATSGGGFLQHVVRGEMTHPLLRSAHCPVVVVPDDWTVPLDTVEGRVVVGYAGEPESRAALAWACEYADLFGLRLDVTQAVVPLPGETVVEPDDPALTRAEGRLGAHRVRLAHLNAASEGAAAALAESAAGAEALVVGNHRVGWVATFTGWSTAERVALDPPCPVVVVPDGDTGW